MEFNELKPSSDTLVRRALVESERLTSNMVTYSLVNGLSIEFKSTEITSMNGESIAFVGGVISVPDNSTSHIMLDLFDKSLHVLPRPSHRGAVLVAKVTAESGRIKEIKQPSTISVPSTRIPKFKSALASGVRTLRVALFGDSLTDGAGGNPRWTALIFDVLQSSLGYNLQNLDRVIVDNYAVGGQTSHFGVVQMGKGVQGVVGKFPITNLTFSQSYLSAYGDMITLPANVKESDARLYQYDLAIINFGANGGSDSIAFIENMVRDLRNLGTEVILGTSNMQTTNPNFLYNEGFQLSRIAEAYGCEFADTWAYVREAQNQGKTTHSDSIHMSADGHLSWAKAIRSVINDLDQVGEVFTNSNQNRIYGSSISAYNGRFPNECEIVFRPHQTSGTVSGAGGSSKLKHPAINMGGKTTADSITILEVGQDAWFGHVGAFAVDILYEMSTTFTADVFVNSVPTKIATITSSQSVPGRVGLREAIGYDVMPSKNSAGPVNNAVRIVVTQGTLKIVGTAFHTWKRREILFEEMNLSGIWGKEVGYYSPSATLYTDTVGDSVYFEFEGNGCCIQLNKRNAAGIVEVYFDGVLIDTKDLYSTGYYAETYWLFPFSESGESYTRGYGKHTVKLKLKDANASAGTVGPKNRRLAIYGAYAIDSR